MSTLETLKSMAERASELLSARHNREDTAFRSCMDACVETRLYFKAFMQHWERDSATEANLAKLWSDVAAAFRRIDAAFAAQCIELSEYWSSPYSDLHNDCHQLYELYGSLRSSCHPRAPEKTSFLHALLK